MKNRNFFPTEVHRKWSVREALLCAKGERFPIGAELLDDATVFVDEEAHRNRSSLVQLTLFKTDEGPAFPDATEARLKDEGLRSADLYESLALARRYPELFLRTRPFNFPMFIFGETVQLPVTAWFVGGRPEWDGACVPVIHPSPGAHVTQPQIRLTARSVRRIGSFVVPAAKL